MPEPDGKQLVADADGAVPDERPGQYARLDELGRGGQSIVWRALDVFVGREVALKELHVRSDTAAGSSATPVRERFLREARITAQLDHPGVVAVHDLARRPDGTLLCAQKLISGETLKARLAACKTLADRLALVPHLIAVCNAIAYAHSRGIIHRDLKPSNIMVGGFGETVVLDWGLAKRRGEAASDAELLGASPTSPSPELTASGVVLGTPAYMSPEQARGVPGEIDERTDVFSLGAILYELLTARRPFDGATAEAVIERVRAGDLRPVRDVCPEAPPELAAIAERALRHDPRDRYTGAERLAAELVAYRAGARVDAYAYRSWDLVRKFAARHRALLAALVVGTAIALAALIVSRVMVERQLHQTRRQLASSYLDRGYQAQGEGDWAKAAAYFAAARVQHDTREERWSLAIARERITERVLVRRGAPESFVDVSVLPDARAIALGYSLDRLEVRDVATDQVLWQRAGEPVLAAAFTQPDVVAIWRPAGWSFHDAASGRELVVWATDRGLPCAGRYPPVVAVAGGALVGVAEGAAARILATDAASGVPCAVSPDGRQAVYQTTEHELRLVSLPDGRELARREVGYYRAVRFSRSHGLVIFDQGRIEIVGGGGGRDRSDFTIDLPDSRFGNKPYLGDPLSGTAVSPDGELVAIAGRRGATEAIVVDLGTRSIRGVIHYAPGAPRFAFAADGRQVFAAGMGNASQLASWRLPPPDRPATPRWWSFGRLFPGGGAALVWDTATRRYEYGRPPERVVATGVLPDSSLMFLLGDGPLIVAVTPDADRVIVHDVATARTLWSHPCRSCRDVSAAFDGGVVAAIGDDGLEVWDTKADRSVFHEARRLRPYAAQCAVSRDGRWVAWSGVDTATIRDLETGREQAIPLDGPIRQLQFGPDSGRLLTITTQAVRVWDLAARRAVWSRPFDMSSIVVSRWSVERGALLLEDGYTATTVLDAATGERIAWFPALSRVVTPVAAEVYANDLTRKAVATEEAWGYRPVPQPDTGSAADRLAEVLRVTGLELRGAELVAAP